MAETTLAPLGSSHEPLLLQCLPSSPGLWDSGGPGFRHLDPLQTNHRPGVIGDEQLDLSIHPSILPSIHPPISPFIYPVIHLLIHLSFSVHPSPYVSMYPCIYVSMCLCIHVSIHLSIHLPFHTSTHSPTHKSIHLPSYLSIYLYLSSIHHLSHSPLPSRKSQTHTRIFTNVHLQMTTYL